jgi:hypothetical protein
MREQDLSESAGVGCLRVYTSPDEVAHGIVESLQADLRESEGQRREKLNGLAQKLAATRSRMDQIYEDKLDGKINEEFWSRKQGALREQN